MHSYGVQSGYLHHNACGFIPEFENAETVILNLSDEDELLIDHDLNVYNFFYYQLYYDNSSLVNEFILDLALNGETIHSENAKILLQSSERWDDYLILESQY